MANVRCRFAFAALALATALPGCAAYHAMPPVGFASADLERDAVIRIAFDQAGDLYPVGSGAALPAPDRAGARVLQLTSELRTAVPPYDPAAQTQSTIGRVTDAIAARPGARLVVLIHGFNNSYAEADASYARVRLAIAEADPAARHLYLQVYWDGLYRGRRTAPFPISYFKKARTYSNTAGSCGLRRIMAALPRGTSVTYLTHSRGAAVALSTASELDWAPKIKHCPPPPRPVAAGANSESGRGDVVLVAYAPAVGDGELRWAEGDLPRRHFDYFRRIVLGIKAHDIATSKVRLGGRYWGDTRAGSDEGYVRALAGPAPIDIEYRVFHGSEHTWSAYLEETGPSRCLLWAGLLIEAKPEGCELTRR